MTGKKETFNSAKGYEVDIEKKYIDDLDELNHQYTNSKIIETYGCIPHDLIGSSRVDPQLPQ